MWEIWKHINAIVFDGATPSIQHVISRMITEGQVWRQAGILKEEVDPFFGALTRWVQSE